MDSVCVMNGFMMIYEKKGWKSRFLRLHSDGKLWYFKDIKSSKPIDKNPIHICGNRIWCESVFPKKPFCIKIERYPEPVFFSSTNEETILSWMDHFEYVGGIRCKFELNTFEPRQMKPFLPLVHWSKDVVKAWMSSTYFNNCESLFTTLFERFDKINGKKLSKINTSFFYKNTAENKLDELVKEDSKFRQVMDHINVIQRRNVFDFGEFVVLKKIQNMTKHLPESEKNRYDLHLLSRILSNPDILIEVFFDLLAAEDTLIPLLRHENRKRKKKKKKKKKKKIRRRPRILDPTNPDPMTEEDFNEKCLEGIIRGDKCRMPIILVLVESFDYTEWKSVPEIFNTIVDHVPRLPSKFSGIVRPALFVGPFLLVWDESGLCIPRKLQPDGEMYKLAIDLSLRQNVVNFTPPTKPTLTNSNKYRDYYERLIQSGKKMSSSEHKKHQQKIQTMKDIETEVFNKQWEKYENYKDLRLKTLTYREIVGSLAKIICRWNRTCINADMNGMLKQLSFLPKYVTKLEFEDPMRRFQKQGSSGLKSIKFKSVISTSEGARSLRSVGDLEDYYPGDSFKFVSDVFEAMGTENFFEEVLVFNLGMGLEEEQEIPGKGGEIPMEFLPSEVGEEYVKSFRGTRKKLKDFGSKETEPIRFMTHMELDRFVNELILGNQMVFQVEYPLVRFLLECYDRVFWMRYLHTKRENKKNDGDSLDENNHLNMISSTIFYKTKKEKLKYKRVCFCRLNDPDFRTRTFSTLLGQRGLVDFAEKIDWGNSKEVEKVIKKDGAKLRCVGDGLNDQKNVVLWAVKQNARALKYASERLKCDPEIVKICVSQDGLTIRYAPMICRPIMDIENDNMMNSNFSDDEEDTAQESEEQGGDLFISEEQRSNSRSSSPSKSSPPKKRKKINLRGLNNIRITALKQNGEALKYLAAVFQDNENLVKTAVQQRGIAIKYASERIKGIEKIALLAVKNDSRAYRYISEDLKKLKHIAMEAVRGDYRLLVEEMNFSQQPQQNQQNKLEIDFKTDDDMVKIFLNQCIGDFSNILYGDLKVKFGNDLVDKIYEGKKNGTFVVGIPLTKITTSSSIFFGGNGIEGEEEIDYVGFCTKKSNQPHGFGFELFKKNSEVNKKIIKKTKKNLRRNLGSGGSGSGSSGSGNVVDYESYMMIERSSKYSKRFVGHYENGERSGTGRLYSPFLNILVYEGQYSNGKRHGRGEHYDIKTGIVQRGNWENGILEGGGNDLICSYPIINYHDVVEKHLKSNNRIATGGFGSVYSVPSSVFKSFFEIGDPNVAVKIMFTNPGLHDNLMFRMTKRGISLICSIPNRQNVLDIYGVIRGKRCCGYVMKLCDISVTQLITSESLPSSSSNDNDNNNISKPTPRARKNSKRKKNKGKDLSDSLEKRMRKFLTMKEKIRILFETARGMRSLHSQLVMHRDLKWENVLLDFDGSANIIDFDTLKEDEISWKLQFCGQTSKIGTQGFVAPEVFLGKEYSLACDVYAFGLMIYSLLWGMNFPFQTLYQCHCGDRLDLILRSGQLDRHVANCNLRPLLNPVEIKKYPSYLIDLMIRCWDKNPFNRPTFEEIVFIFECERTKLVMKEKEVKKVLEEEEEKEENNNNNNSEQFLVLTFQFPQFETVIKDQKFYMTKPYQMKKIVEWIEKKRFDGSKLVRLRFNHPGKNNNMEIRSDDDIEKHLVPIQHQQSEEEIILVAELDQVDEEKIVDFYGDRKRKIEKRTENKQHSGEKEIWKEKYEQERKARKEMEKMILEQLELMKTVGSSQNQNSVDGGNNSEQVQKLLHMQLQLLQSQGMSTSLLPSAGGSEDRKEEETEGEE